MPLEFIRKKLAEDINPDEFLPLLCQYILKFGFSKSLVQYVKLALLLHVLAYALQVHYILANGIALTQKYATQMVMQLYLIYIAVNFCFAQKIGMGSFTEMRRIPIPWKHLGRARRVVEKQRRNLQVSTILLVAPGIPFSFFFSPFVSDAEDLYLFLQISDSYFGSWSILVRHVYFVTMAALSWATVTLTFGFLYFVKIACVHLRLINEHFRCIPRAVDDEIANERRQNEIHERLRVGVERYTRVTHLMKDFIEKNVTPVIVPTIFFAVVILMGAYFNLMQLGKNGELMLIRCIIVLAYGYAVLGNAVICGQSVMDESEEIAQLGVNCEWISWNIRNRKSLLLILTHAVKPITMSIFTISLDYRLLMTLIRMPLSYALTLHQIQNS